MNPAIISALAALAGARHRRNSHPSSARGWLNRYRRGRRLFCAASTPPCPTFIKNLSTSRCQDLYRRAPAQTKPTCPLWLGLPKISRMRALSSTRIVEGADQIAKKIIDACQGAEQDLCRASGDDR